MRGRRRSRSAALPFPDARGVGKNPCLPSPALSLAALRSEAQVFVAMSAREGDRLRVFLEGPFPVSRTGDRHRDVREHTRRIAEVVERYIRRYPEQWLWLHRRWKVVPTGNSWGGAASAPEPTPESEAEPPR